MSEFCASCAIGLLAAWLAARIGWLPTKASRAVTLSVVAIVVAVAADHASASGWSLRGELADSGAFTVIVAALASGLQSIANLTRRGRFRRVATFVSCCVVVFAGCNAFMSVGGLLASPFAVRSGPLAPEHEYRMETYGGVLYESIWTEVVVTRPLR